VVENRVHAYAAGKQTFLPQLATFKLSCYQLPLGSELDCCQLGRPYSLHISKAPPLGASVDPLCNLPSLIQQRSLLSPLVLCTTLKIEKF
jgi:hypothetical protein